MTRALGLVRTLALAATLIGGTAGAQTIKIGVNEPLTGAFAASGTYVVNGAKTMAPASWWAMHGKHLPHLSSVARRVLAQPICASAAERNWSVYGAIKTTARSRLGHAVADKLVYCHEALHLQSKLQKASYKQVAEKWDTDSDSDESDEEDLKV